MWTIRVGCNSVCDTKWHLLPQTLPAIRITFHKHILCTEVFCTVFPYLQFEFVVFWHKEINAKAARKMLVKLTFVDWDGAQMVNEHNFECGHFYRSQWPSHERLLILLLPFLTALRRFTSIVSNSNCTSTPLPIPLSSWKDVYVCETDIMWLKRRRWHERTDEMIRCLY